MSKAPIIKVEAGHWIPQPGGILSLSPGRFKNLPPLEEGQRVALVFKPSKRKKIKKATFIGVKEVNVPCCGPGFTCRNVLNECEFKMAEKKES